ASKPVRDGVIADYVITEHMLKHFIDKVCGNIRIFRPELMICVPSGVTSVERRAVKDAAIRAGARAAHLIEEPLAAAIGANIPISGPSGNLIIDIGGGTAEIAVISLGGIVVSRSVRAAGNKLDEAIANFVRKRYNLMIGERTAEDVKIQIGSALPMDPELTMEVRGRDLIAGLPRTITIGSNEITEAMDPVLQQIIGAVKAVREETRTARATDVMLTCVLDSSGGAAPRQPRGGARAHHRAPRRGPANFRDPREPGVRDAYAAREGARTDRAKRRAGRGRWHRGASRVAHARRPVAGSCPRAPPRARRPAARHRARLFARCRAWRRGARGQSARPKDSLTRGRRHVRRLARARKR